MHFQHRLLRYTGQHVRMSERPKCNGCSVPIKHCPLLIIHPLTAAHLLPKAHSKLVGHPPHRRRIYHRFALMLSCQWASKCWLACVHCCMTCCIQVLEKLSKLLPVTAQMDLISSALQLTVSGILHELVLINLRICTKPAKPNSEAWCWLHAKCDAHICC